MQPSERREKSENDLSLSLSLSVARDKRKKRHERKKEWRIRSSVFYVGSVAVLLVSLPLPLPLPLPLHLRQQMCFPFFSRRDGARGTCVCSLRHNMRAWRPIGSTVVSVSLSSGRMMNMLMPSSRSNIQLKPVAFAEAAIWKEDHVRGERDGAALSGAAPSDSGSDAHRLRRERSPWTPSSNLGVGICVHTCMSVYVDVRLSRHACSFSLVFTDSIMHWKKPWRRGWII